jgi:hypothetical protein
MKYVSKQSEKYLLRSERGSSMGKGSEISNSDMSPQSKAESDSIGGGRNKSNSSSGSMGGRRLNDFLERNFYSVKAKKEEKINKVKEQMDRNEQDKRQREFSAWNAEPNKGRSGSLISRGSSASKNSASNFKPYINENSKSLSKMVRSNDQPVYQQLYSDSQKMRENKEKIRQQEMHSIRK